MNRIKNDRNEYVVAVGAPYSNMRTACKYPQLIDNIKGRWALEVTPPSDHSRLSDVIGVMDRAGITDQDERFSILSYFYF